LTTDLINEYFGEKKENHPYYYSWIDRLFLPILLGLNLSRKGISPVNDAQFTAVLVKVCGS
jgi:hypothetical protein